MGRPIAQATRPEICSRHQPGPSAVFVTENFCTGNCWSDSGWRVSCGLGFESVIGGEEAAGMTLAAEDAPEVSAANAQLGGV